MIFISYSSQNEDLATELYNKCQNLNFKAWFAPKSIKIGENYASIITQAVKNSEYFILILSEHSINSDQVKRELGLAIKYKKKIFPLKIDEYEISGDFEYFLEGVQWILVDNKSYFTQSINYLLKLLSVDNESLTIKSQSPTDIISNQKETFYLVDEIDDIELLLIQAIAIDTQYYNDELVGQLDTCLNWYYEDNNIYTFVVNQDNNVVGYINSMIVDKNTFDSILKGNFIDNDIPKESLVQAFMPGIYRMYFCSIAIDQKYKKDKNVIFKLLYNGFFQKLLNLALDGCFIQELVADAITYEGKNLAESFGMEAFTTTNHNSAIFYAKLLPPNFRFYEGITQDVFKLYKNYYDNYIN